MLGDLGVEGFCITQKGKYTSGQILPLFESGAIALFGEECTEVKEGDLIKVLPYKMLWGEVECDYIN